MKKTLLALATLAASWSSNAAIMTIGNVTDNGSGQYTISNASGSVTDSVIESFLGLSSGTLDSISTGNAKEGSALKDTVQVNAGSEYSFDWTWFSSEDNGVSYNDFSFVSLSLDGTEVLADTFVNDNFSSSFSWTATTSGLLTYGIGVMDVNDEVVSSTLNVSNISVSEVSEPVTLAIFGLGLVGLAGLRRSRK